MYHDERIFREDDRGHTETTQVSIPKDVSCCAFLFEFFSIGKLKKKKRS
jgi:hypothetical protein